MTHVALYIFLIELPAEVSNVEMETIDVVLENMVQRNGKIKII